MKSLRTLHVIGVILSGMAIAFDQFDWPRIAILLLAANTLILVRSHEVLRIAASTQRENRS